MFSKKYSLTGQYFTIGLTNNNQYKGVYIEDSETILISKAVKSEDIIDTIIHELTHFVYAKHFVYLEDVTKRYNPQDSLGNYTSEALATFNGRFSREIQHMAKIILEDIRFYYTKKTK